MSKHTLPPIPDLFSQSWNLFRSRLLQIFLVNLVGIGIGALIFAIFVIIMLVLGAGTFFANKEAIQDGTFPYATFIIPLLLFFLIIIVWSIVLQVANIIVMATKSTFSDSLKNSIRFVWPLFLVGILSSIFIIGGFFFFIIPAIIFGILFSFTTYEVVLNNHKGLAAIKRSVTLFSWPVFGRLLILIGISLTVQFLTSLLSSGEEVGLGTFLAVILGVLFGWFSLSYSVTLYKHAAAENHKDRSMTWIYVITALGWLLLLSLIYFGTQNLSKYLTPDMFNNLNFQNNNIETFEESTTSGNYQLD